MAFENPRVRAYAGVSGKRIESVRRELAAVAMAGLAGGLLALGGCEKGKTRHLPPDPFAAPPPAPGAAAAAGPSSVGLARRPEMAGFFLDHAGQAVDPLNRRPAVTPAGQPVALDGFGFDAVALKPGKGVDVVVDGKVYGTAYGSPRPDVARFFKAPQLANTGFRTVLPSSALAAGPHTAIVRVVASSGKGYYDSPAVSFEVK